MNHLKAVALAVAIAASPAAFAQQASPPMHADMPMNMPMNIPMKMMQPMASDSAATKGYKEAMMGSMMRMPPFTGDADIDFMKQMRLHHQGVIDMAKVALANGKDGEVRKLAEDVVRDQAKEIAMIEKWLKARGQ